MNLEVAHLPHNYRPDIDGLRAIAILAVILYHMDLSFMRGGFVGVDVFFVISGFLITSIIEQSLSKNSFTLKDFYLKRARRILPSFIIVTFSVMLLGLFLLLSDEFVLLGKSITSGVFFWSNMWLNSQTGYFDKVSDLKPLLHFWSLAVEEQFYFIWPLLLIYIPAKNKKIALIILCLVSILYSLYNSIHHPSRAFYFLASRFWQMGIGGILAIGVQSKKIKLPKITSHIISCIGFVLIIVAAIYFTKNDCYPSWRAMLPTLGAVLIIASGNSGFINKNILSTRIMVAIGLISYPLYLWHWPLLYFVRVMSIMESSLFHRIMAVALSFIGAYLCTHFIESKFRKIPTHSPILMTLIKIHFVLGILGISAIYLGNFNRASDSLKVGQKSIYKKNIVKNCLLPPELKKEANWCETDKRSTPNKLIIGDSHAGALFPSLLETSQHGDSWQIISKAGCAPHIPNCKLFFTSASSQLMNHPEINEVLVVFSSRKLDRSSAKHLHFETDLDNSPREIVESELSNFIKSLKTTNTPNRKIKFLIAPPAITSEPQFCLERPFSLNNKSTRLACTLSRGEVDSTMLTYRNLVKNIKIQNIDLIIIDPIDIFCNKFECKVKNLGLSNYSYADHISDIAGLKIAQLIQNY